MCLGRSEPLTARSTSAANHWSEVTGRSCPERSRVERLRHRTRGFFRKWRTRQDSTRRPPGLEGRCSLSYARGCWTTSQKSSRSRLLLCPRPLIALGFAATLLRPVCASRESQARPSPRSTFAVANAPHVSISERRSSNKSLRKYAASALSRTTCAKAASQTARGTLVRSAAQSRNALRNPCAVMSSRFNRRSIIKNAIFDNGFFADRPGNT